MARKDPATAGVNVASRIAAIMTKTRVDSTAQLIPPMQKAIVDSLTLAFTRIAPGDSKALRAFLEEEYGGQSLTPETNRLLDAFEGLKDIATSGLLLIAILLSIVPIITAAAGPHIERERITAWASNPLRPLDVGSAASASMRGILDRDDAIEDAAQGGFNADRFSILQQLGQTRPATEEVLTLRNRGAIDDADVLKYLEVRGFDDTDAERIAELRRVLPSAAEAQTLRNRDVIDDGELEEYLRQAGFDENDVERIAGLRQVLPGPADVVRFALRDVYRPEAVARGDLLADLPTEGIADAERVGLAPEEFTKFWASHWVLPSVGQAFEMLHRGVISLDELRDLLRTQDIAPGWRDELIEIAFRVITRVDIRRMYREGIADETKVLETYVAQGYTPEDAQSLTEFAIADATIDARELTKSEVIKLYQDGAMTRADAVELLDGLGFAGPETEWLLVLAEFRRFAKFRELAVSRVRSRYVGRRLSQSEASTALDRIGVVPTERDNLIDLWDGERDAERPSLTMALVGRLYDDDIITEEDARVRWGELGYRSTDIDLLVLNYSGGDPEDKTSGPKAKQLTKSDIGRALRDGTISTAEAIAAWVAMGYTEGAAHLLAANYLPDEET